MGLVAPVTFKPGPRKTLEETAHAVSSVLISLAYLRDPADNMPVSDKDIVGEDAS